ncbi:MAG: MarR family winged helix-turn-helix transcriptional regulator [Christensenella sp.]|uniref:MarR family winged helix-turn-helix transcriptional regulator n=1 Tax=Christensenella sp. TaxID=1935934 RepID=UPI002B216BE4|nr:MarR family winged helix-turn-helix transcriptional regulator [Christensenella sp.]MEA5003340.1 MarR family winged helix-turn-helix transcriptional regulator [Christensenella sp.]
MEGKWSKEQEARMTEKWNSINRLSEEYAKAAGLTPMSLAVLTIIYENQMDCTQKLICEQSQFNKQSVNMIVKSFWEQGYVELAESKSDRRNKQVTLSGKGKKYAKRLVEPLLTVEQSALGRLTLEQSEVLLMFLDIYEEYYQKGITELKDSLNKGRDDH